MNFRIHIVTTIPAGIIPNVDVAIPLDLEIDQSIDPESYKTYIETIKPLLDKVLPLLAEKFEQAF